MIKKILIISSLFLVPITIAKSPNPNKWETVDKPLDGLPQSIGKYNRGCIIGAKAMPLQGEGYRVIRSKRNRYYGHPDLIQTLGKLASRVKQNELGLMLIADMSMPVGGPFTKGHASHQSGLDADIWLNLNYKDPTASELESPKRYKVVNSSQGRTNDKFTSKHAQLIKLAAQDSKVQRVFVNYAIKHKLCTTVTGDRSWLQKVRPWGGHNYHIHIRLKCPAGSSNCKPQKAVAKNDGCDLKYLARAAKPRKYIPPTRPVRKPTPRYLRKMPSACDSILSKAIKNTSTITKRTVHKTKTSKVVETIDNGVNLLSSE